MEAAAVGARRGGTHIVHRSIGSEYKLVVAILWSAPNRPRIDHDRHLGRFDFGDDSGVSETQSLGSPSVAAIPVVGWFRDIPELRILAFKPLISGEWSRLPPRKGIC